MLKRDSMLLRHLAAAFLVAIVASLANGPVMAQVTFDWSTVGDPGNVPDTAVMNKPAGAPNLTNTTGYGTVDYAYRISTYHVTNTQYVEFLNAVDPSGSNSLSLYSRNMSDHFISGLGTQVATTGGIDQNLSAAVGSRYSVKAGQEQYPAVWVQWSSAARFVKWLSNGQGSAAPRPASTTFRSSITSTLSPRHRPGRLVPRSSSPVKTNTTRRPTTTPTRTGREATGSTARKPT